MNDNNMKEKKTNEITNQQQEKKTELKKMEEVISVEAGQNSEIINENQKTQNKN